MSKLGDVVDYIDIDLLAGYVRWDRLVRLDGYVRLDGLVRWVRYDRWDR